MATIIEMPKLSDTMSVGTLVKWHKKTGDIVKVKVMEVDADRKRVSFTMRMGDTPNQANKPKHAKPKQNNHREHTNRSSSKPVKQSNQMMGNAFADAFAKAKK